MDPNFLGHPSNVTSLCLEPTQPTTEKTKIRTSLQASRGREAPPAQLLEPLPSKVGGGIFGGELLVGQKKPQKKPPHSLKI